jgi:tetratricopeptide (TPR) repeat protein
MDSPTLLPERFRLGTLSALMFAGLILLIGLWIYWPGIHGPVLLDDRSSVMVIGDLKNRPELAFDYIFGDKSGALGRSVSMTSFVLEKMYLDEGITGGKKINIVLHLLNGGLVIWLFWLLFRYLDVPGYRALAVLLGAVWLLHPLLVSTVLYVVQRMAMLATFFMLLSSISYLYWRFGLIAGKTGVWRFLPVPAFLVIALLSKENAIVLVPVLLLMEVLWFEFAGRDGKVITWLRGLTYSLIATGAIAMSAILLFRWDHLAARFGGRAFTLEERLFTQTRILWDYVAQLVHPQVARMGLYHDDVVLSRGLLEPASTLYAVAAWLLLIAICGLLLRWQAGRWIVFGIAWFLLGHSVESTVLSLELYFEHRNYFPAIGLVLALGGLFAAIVKKWPEPKSPLLPCLGLCALLLSLLTSSQVQIWSNRSLLLLSQLNAHPQSTRANIDMAVKMAELEQVEAAYHYSRLAFETSANAASSQELSGDYEVRNLALSCIANKAVPTALIDDLGREYPNRPFSSVTTLLTMVRLLQDNRCPQIDRIRFADRLAEIFLVEDFKHKASANIFSNLAVLENALQRYDNAYAYAERFLALSPDNTRGLLMKLHFATALGKVEAAQSVIATLQRIDQQGNLTVGEQQTLALYFEE